MTVLYLNGTPINWAKPPAPTFRVMWSGASGWPGVKVTGSFRHICHLEYLDREARKKFKTGIKILQPAYHKGYAGSAGTHDFDACVDLHIPGVDWLVQQRFFRERGLGCWWRHPPTFGHHIHGFTLPRQEGISRSDDWAIAGYTVGKYVDGGWSLYGRKVASAQIEAYYMHLFGLKGDSTSRPDKTWFPPDIAKTIFKHKAFILDMREAA
jgi:hypothetical protein